MNTTTLYYEKICRNIPKEYQNRVYDLFLHVEESMITEKNNFFKNLDQACHCCIIKIIPEILLIERSQKNFWNQQYRRYFDKGKAVESCKKNNYDYIKEEKKYISSLDDDIQKCGTDPEHSCPLCFEEVAP